MLKLLYPADGLYCSHPVLSV